MPHAHEPHRKEGTSHAADPRGTAATALPVDPRTFGLVKVAYTVRETLELLSIGRTSLYAAVNRGELKRIKLGKRTLFCAVDLAAFLAGLRAASAEQSLRPNL
jgi:hypothetical protein